MSNEIVKQEGIPAISHGPFQATAVGLVVTEENVPYELWQAYGSGLRQVEGAIQWIIGDWLNYGERKYGEMYSQAMDETDYEYGTLANDKYVAGKVQFSHRCEDLSWVHHREVAPLDPDEQEHWLNEAVEQGYTVKELRQAIRTARLDNVNTVEGERVTRLIHGDMVDILPGLGLFDLVVTDPPYGVVPKYDSVDPLEWDRFEDFLGQARDWLDVVKAALKPDYNLFWFCAPAYAARIEHIFTEMELPIQSRIIWHRRSLPKGRAATDRFISTWDMILHAGNRPLNFPTEWSDAWFDVQVFTQPLTSFNGIDQKIHETQKPSGLIERLVNFGSFAGDRVLDPFAGSGVVGATCPDDRECVLIEREDVYVNRIEQRLGIRAEAP